MNQILEGIAKVNDTFNEIDKGYAHARSSQVVNIEKDLLDDDTCLSQGGSALPQSPPSTIPAFGTSVNTSSMGTRGNTTIDSPHTCNKFTYVSGKIVGNKRCRLSGDMAYAFKKLIEYLEKIETLKLELQREAIITTKSIAQSMIAIKV
jgi:hypothetical protein